MTSAAVWSSASAEGGAVGDLRWLWPAVFYQPLDEPYRPDASGWARRGLALADIFSAWGLVHSKQMHPRFGEVLVKLSGIAGVENAADNAELIAAKEAWMAEKPDA